MFSKSISECHLHARIENEVIAMHAITVVVSASWEIITTNSINSTKAVAKLHVDKKIKILVVPKSNFMSLGKTFKEMDLTEFIENGELLFDLQALQEGNGEIYIFVEQSGITMLHLTIKPKIVNNRNANTVTLNMEQIAVKPKQLMKPLHQLWVQEQRFENGTKFQYHFYSEKLKISQWSSSELISGDRKDYVKSFYLQIENKLTSTDLDKQNFAEELRAFGANLFDELIPDELKKTLWEHRHNIKSIQLISTEPFIPWELIHLRDPARKGMPKDDFFLGEMGLIRWLHGAGENGWPSETIKIRKGQARYVIPKYPHPDYVLPEAEMEIKFLMDKFEATPVTPESGKVREEISEPGKFDLLHFACHGGADLGSILEAKLLMQGRIERNNYITDSFTVGIASAYGDLKAQDNMPLVVLNACQCGRMGFKLAGIGGFADAFLSNGAGAFIGTLWSIGDIPARIFTETLYEELLNGENLSTATISARHAARDSGEATWLAYTVYGHPHMKITQ